MTKATAVYFINEKNIRSFSSAFTQECKKRGLSNVIVAFKDLGVLTEDRETKNADLIFVDLSVICTNEAEKVISEKCIAFLAKFQRNKPDTPIVIFCDNTEEEIAALQSRDLEEITEHIFNWRTPSHLRITCKLIKKNMAQKISVAV